MASRYLSSSDAGERTLQGAFGRPVISYYPQLQTYLTERLGPEIASHFAEPLRDGTARRIDWFTEGDGPARAWRDLTAEQRHKAETTLQDWRNRLHALASEVPPTGGEEIHRILSMILSEPSEQTLFLIDGRPVVTDWGFETATRDTGQPTTPPAVIRRGHRPDALTLCMLAAMALALATGTLHALGTFADPPATPRATASPRPSQPSQQVSELRRLQARNDRLRKDIDGLQEDALSRALACLGQCAAPATPVPIAPPAAPPQSAPGAPLVIPDGAAEAGDLSFLEGTWRSTSESLAVTFTDSNRPDQSISVEYTLDDAGQGQRVVTMQDGTQCKGPVAARFDADGHLQIEEGGPADCGDGVKVIPYRLTCEIAADGLAICGMSPRDRDGAGSVRTELRRVP